MKNYDYIFKSQAEIQESLNREEAVAAIAVISAIVDDGIENIDAESLAGILWEFDLFAEYSDEEMLETIDRLIEIAEKQGLGSLFNAANVSLDDEVLLDGFAAGIIMLLDPQKLIIPKSKLPYIEELQKALELAAEEAEEIIQEIIDIVADTDKPQQVGYKPIIINDLGQEVYQSPWGNFQVLIPVNVEQGGRVQTDDGLVAFHDDLGRLFKIEYYPLSLEQLDNMEDEGQENFLHETLIKTYIPQMIIANIPQAEIQYTEYLEDAEETSLEISLKYYYAFVYLSKGATISHQNNNGKAIKIDAYRGLLSFINDEFLYIVSIQHSLFYGETDDAISVVAQTMKQKILEFISTIEFTEK